jgi:CspA family cold shock protein
MKTGVVKFFNTTKGFGFIVDDETKREIFVHVTGLDGGAIQENDKVEFVEERGPKGANAVNVRKV